MNIEKHIKDLHAKLKITAAEETQWAAVTKAMHDNADELDKVIDKRDAMIGNASAVDNLNAYGDIARAHADAIKNLSAAFAPLYAAMPDDQKKLADQVFAQRAAHEGKNAKAMK
ncbi:MAG: Spy/CpxP family protein refolding chaperone [Collimonas sp.]|uniref:Spy/CpxP family protein refolding chaperone n=1 Tax=Collimonas sp. TaxID=1963772 RepID=UPI0032653780